MKYIAGALLLILCFGGTIHPDYNLRVYSLVQGSEWQKGQAKKWHRIYCKKYKVSEKVMYKIMYNESRGNPSAYNKNTHARGLYQITYSAVSGLRFARQYYAHRSFGFVLYKHYWYSIKWNTKAACAIMQECNRLAPLMRCQFPQWFRLFVSEQDFAVLLYCYGWGHLREWKTVLNYIGGM